MDAALTKKNIMDRILICESLLKQNSLDLFLKSSLETRNGLYTTTLYDRSVVRASLQKQWQNLIYICRRCLAFNETIKEFCSSSCCRSLSGSNDKFEEVLRPARQIA